MVDNKSRAYIQYQDDKNNYDNVKILMKKYNIDMFELSYDKTENKFSITKISWLNYNQHIDLKNKI